VRESTAEDDAPERAFLDANVIRGQLTNDILLSLAEQDLLNPRWSQTVLDEMRRNRPSGVTEQRIDRRIAAMNTYFPRAMTSGHDRLIPEMQADAKDKHVLAAAVHSRCAVLVTDNIKDFDPPSAGPYAMRIERLSQFLNRKLQEQPDRVASALQTMVDRNRLDPRTMPALIDKMATQPELRPFAQKLNESVPLEQRGSHEALATDHQIGSIHTQASAAAFKGIAPADGAVIKAPRSNPETRRPDSAGHGQDREPER
jgi:PIN domain